MVAIPKWHLEACTTITRYEKSVAACLNVTIKKVTNGIMRYYFGYVVFVVWWALCDVLTIPSSGHAFALVLGTIP
jgi:hypothetical protein